MKGRAILFARLG